MLRRINSTLRLAWRAIVAVVGFTLVLLGIALLVLPGPAFIVIPLGLAVLASEFVWARRLLKSVRARLQRARVEQARRQQLGDAIQEDSP